MRSKTVIVRSGLAAVIDRSGVALGCAPIAQDPRIDPTSRGHERSCERSDDWACTIACHSATPAQSRGTHPRPATGRQYNNLTTKMAEAHAPAMQPYATLQRGHCGTRRIGIHRRSFPKPARIGLSTEQAESRLRRWIRSARASIRCRYASSPRMLIVSGMVMVDFGNPSGSARNQRVGVTIGPR